MSESPGELVSDAYAFYDPSPQHNPKSPPNLLERMHDKPIPPPAQVYRGEDGRVSERAVAEIGGRIGNFGIRLVLDK
jgi:hypothetical protein